MRDGKALVERASPLLTSRLPLDRPLWSATLLSGPGGPALALVVVLHHALSDGVGGLAVLS